MEPVRLENEAIEIAFEIVVESGQKTGLVLRPRVYCPNLDGFEQHYVITEATMATPQGDLTGGDYLRVGNLLQCHETLRAFCQKRPGHVDVWSLDGSYDLECCWCAKGQDVCIRVHFPSRHDYVRGDDWPPHYKGEIIERRSFEFYLDTEELAPPIYQLERLLATLRSLSESSNGRLGEGSR